MGYEMKTESDTSTSTGSDPQVTPPDTPKDHTPPSPQVTPRSRSSSLTASLSILIPKQQSSTPTPASPHSPLRSSAPAVPFYMQIPSPNMPLLPNMQSTPPNPKFPFLKRSANEFITNDFLALRQYAHNFPKKCKYSMALYQILTYFMQSPRLAY